MTVRELIARLGELAATKPDWMLDRPALVRVQDDEGGTYVGNLFSANLEVGCGGEDDEPDLILDGTTEEVEA